MGVSIDETVREKDINDLFGIFKVEATAEQVSEIKNQLDRGIDCTERKCILGVSKS